MYAAVFRGQAKSLETEEYVIPLLAPYDLVQRGLTKLRGMIDTAGLTTEKVNTTFQKSIATALAKFDKSLNPHMLRAIYAVSAYELLGAKRMSLMGYISKVLGHVTPSNALYYSRIKVVNLTGPYKPKTDVVWKLPAGWIAKTLPEQKRVRAIQQMILRRQRITASALRTESGGVMSVNQRVIDNNKTLIDKYHAGLA